MLRLAWSASHRHCTHEVQNSQSFLKKADWKTTESFSFKENRSAIVLNSLSHIIYGSGFIFLIFLTLLKVICWSWNSCRGLTASQFEEFSGPGESSKMKFWSWMASGSDWALNSCNLHFRDSRVQRSLTKANNGDGKSEIYKKKNLRLYLAAEIYYQIAWLLLP